ncbi:hypothetical protein HDU97_001149 [Phlyctochytrium planicorne]|nr:hypothetical protein HDU97_001149 [Phlyctochytrium planicorne]
MRRDRQKDGGAAGGKSQLKVNESAKSIICGICRQTFLLTVREKALQDHINSKHDGKTLKDCFPNFQSS